MKQQKQVIKLSQWVMQVKVDVPPIINWMKWQIAQNFIHPVLLALEGNVRVGLIRTLINLNEGEFK